MENQERGLAGARGEPFVRTKGDPGKAQRWTVIIMGRVGKVRTFKISPRLIFWTLLFLALYFPASLLVFNHWVELRRTSRQQQERIAQVEEERAKAERALFKFKQHVSLLETYIVSLEEPKARPAAGAVEAPETADVAAEETPAREPNTVEKEPSQPQKEQGSDPEASAPERVGVEEMAFTIDPGSIRVNFNLMNVDRGEDPVSGYIHILASGTRNGETWWEVYPRGGVENGLPASYRVGQPFIIQRFKPVQGRFDIRPDRGMPTTVRIVVYDDTGRLIYNMPFEVDHAS